MALPKKIDSRCIKDAIIEVKYTSKLPFEVMIGYIFMNLDDTFNYTNRNFSPNDIGNKQNIQFNIGNQYLFFNEYIKIQVHPGAIIFNCLKEYVLWDAYLPQIKNVLEQILVITEIQTFDRVGVRYISEFENVDFKDTLNFNFSFNQPSISSKSFSFKSEFIVYENCQTILQIHNELAVGNLSDGSSQTISQIDIDVIKQNLSIPSNSLDELLHVIDSLHSIEKELFFNLLKAEFLTSLNPIY
jgi:uncharacterized protein (TIGR04255 family)